MCKKKYLKKLQEKIDRKQKSFGFVQNGCASGTHSKVNSEISLLARYSQTTLKLLLS